MKNEAPLPHNHGLLAALGAAILLASLGISIATVALPTLVKTFSASVEQVQWVVLAYLLAVTVAIVSAGRMADLYGQRRMLLASLVLFILASAVCTLAPDLGWLIAGRVGQGLGAAALMSLPMSIAKSLVAKERIGTAMGLLGSMSAIGTALGPGVGGVLMGALGWRSAFALLGLLGACLLALATLAIPAAKARGAPAGGMDWAGHLWLSIMLICFALAATGGKVAMAIPLWLLPALGAVAGLAFVRTEMACANPLVPMGLLRERAIAMPLASNLVVGAVMMSTLVVGPFFLSFGLGLDEAQTGMVLAAGPVAAAFCGVPAGRITDRFGAQRSLLAGLALATAGLCGFALLPALIGVPGYVLALMLVTPGFQLFLAGNNTAMMLGAAPAHKGTLAGLLGLSRNLGLMLGASLLPMLFSSVLGAHGVASSSRQAIGEAFSITFLSTAGLCLLSLLLASVRQARPGPSR